MKNLRSKVWWERALTRAIKTVAETFVAVVGTSKIISEVDWMVAFSSAALAAIISLGISLAGLPEVKEEVKTNE